jgi:hypothetical protein
VDVARAVEPRDAVLGRRLRFSDDDRKSVDKQHDIEAAFLNCLVGDFPRHDELVGTRVLEVDEPDGERGLLTDELNLLASAQPVHHPFVGRNDAVFDDREHGRPEARQDLVDSACVLRDSWVQPDERIGDVRLDECADVLPRELLRRHLGPTDVGLREPVYNGCLNGVGLGEAG